MNTDNAFHLSICGQLEAANYPLGAPSRELFARFDFVAGPDWQLVSGIATGVTQCARAGDAADGDGGAEVVFNMPVELMYRATNAHGWPQLVVTLFGRNWWGTETACGYARLHLPIHRSSSAHSNPQSSSHQLLRAPILQPQSTSFWGALLGWASDRRPELRDPRVLCDGARLRGLCVESYGSVAVRLETLQRGTRKLGYDWGNQQGGRPAR